MIEYEFKKKKYHKSSKDRSSAHTWGANNEKLDFGHLCALKCNEGTYGFFVFKKRGLLVKKKKLKEDKKKTM